MTYNPTTTLMARSRFLTRSKRALYQPLAR
ncbi:MAG: hypothetical protein ACI90G_001641, partial [Urechidicola sp.]